MTGAPGHPYRPLNRFKRGRLRLNRIEAFSDGVFAIVVTLLVLDLRVPERLDHRDTHELGVQLIALLPKLLSWLISFIIVCKFWLNHHYVVGLARYADYAMVWLNSLFLMLQSFIPFPTALMGAYPGNPLAVSAFGVVMALNTLMFMILQSYILRNLIKPELLPAQDPKILRKALVGPIGYLLGAGAAWLSPPAAFVFYLLTPLLFITPVTRDTATDDAPDAEDPAAGQTDAGHPDAEHDAPAVAEPDVATRPQLPATGGAEPVAAPLGAGTEQEA